MVEGGADQSRAEQGVLPCSAFFMYSYIHRTNPGHTRRVNTGAFFLLHTGDSV